MTDDRMMTFIHSFDRGKPPYLEELERYSIEAGVPIIRHEMQNLLRFLIAWAKPKSILEVGTAIGFSALFMSEHAPPGCHITTIEKYEKRIPAARENFAKAGRENDITLMEGDAVNILSNLTGEFDLIFMDAAKGQYINFLPDVLRLLSAGGVLVSDNILQDGDLLESRYAIKRRNRTIHYRMREYLYALTHSEELETMILPIADGAAVSVRRIGMRPQDLHFQPRNKEVPLMEM